MRCVYIRAAFIRIGDIKTAQENFTADFLLQCRWREPELDKHDKWRKRTEIELEHPENYWNPKIVIDNNIVETKGNTWYVVHYNHKDEAFVCERRRVKSIFYENMELNLFPFDTQDLTVSLSSLLGEDDVVLEEDTDELSTIHENAFTDKQEWYLHDQIHTVKKSTSDAYSIQRRKHPTLCISCKATRRAFFFITNVVIISLVICGLVFTTFSVDISNVQSRLQLSFILLLSNITFKFVSSQNLPKVSYLTTLDKYILIQMGILCSVCVWHSVGYEIKDDKKSKLADALALYVIGGLYIVVQLAFMLYWAITVCLTGRRLRKPDIDYAKTVAYQQKNPAVSTRQVPCGARSTLSYVVSPNLESPQKNQIQPLSTLQIAQTE